MDVRVTACLVIALQIVKKSDAKGILEIKLISYNNPSHEVADGSCCDDLWGSCKANKCDPWIELCVDLASSSSKICALGKQKTPVYDNTDMKTFGPTEGHFTYSFTTVKGGLHVKIITMEDDSNDGTIIGSTAPDAMDTTSFDVKSLAGINGRPNVARTRIHVGSIANFNLEYLMYCDLYYYDDCTKYCKPDPLHHTCDSLGNKVCLPAWKGPHCIINASDDCYQNNCYHGATCIDHTSSYTCICPPGVTGVLCNETTTTSAISLTPPSTDIMTTEKSTIDTTSPQEAVTSPDTTSPQETVTSPDTTSPQETVTSSDTTSPQEAVTSPDTTSTQEPVTSPFSTLFYSGTTALEFRIHGKKTNGYVYILVSAVACGGVIFLTTLACLLFRLCKRKTPQREDTKPLDTPVVVISLKQQPTSQHGTQPSKYRGHSKRVKPIHRNAWDPSVIVMKK